MLVTDKYQDDVAIQLVVNGSQFEDFVRFRNILNQNPQLVIDYNILKQECGGGPSSYRAKQSLFIERVLNSFVTNT